MTATLAGYPPTKIELRNSDSISTIQAYFTVQGERLGKHFSKLQILANGKYLLATKRENLWLIDTLTRRAELLAFDSPENWHICGEGLRASRDERFALLTWKNRNPILCDLKRKITWEIKMANQQEIRQANIVDVEHSRSSHLSYHNDLLLFILDRKVYFVCLKKGFEAQSLGQLVDLIKSYPMSNQGHDSTS
jgi:hypothetical protein